MGRLRVSWLIPFSAFLLTAAEPIWKNKPIATWTEEDARQILERSPWAKLVLAGITRRETEDERAANIRCSFGATAQVHGPRSRLRDVHPASSGGASSTSAASLLARAVGEYTFDFSVY